MSVGKLPEGWVNTTIENISVKCSQRVPNENDEFIYVDIGSINRDLKIIENPQYLSGKNAPSRARKVIKAGDVIVSLTRPNLNAVALINENYDDQIASTGFEVIHPVQVESRYVFGLVRSRHFIDSISGLVQGALYPAAKSSDVQSYEFPLPPLAEQKIIAEKLDTLLAQVDGTKARLEQIPKILKRFRQAVLAAAMNGKLTEEWRSVNLNVPKFSEKFDNIKYFRNAELPEIPESWQWLRFDQIAEIASNLKSPLHFPNTTHIAPNHIESWTGKVFGYQTISEDGVTSAKHEFYKGQIIYSKIRPYLCKVAIASFDGLCSADMYPINSKIDTYFLFRWMLTTTFTDWASNAESRTVLPKINQKDLSEIPVPVPPLSEQNEIVRRVEQLFAYADTIEKQVNSALARVNNLTQSILAKAFRGELTAQWRAENPELISGENSAAVLLEKIKAERAASTGKKASRKKS